MKRFFEQELRVLRSHLVEMGQKAIEQVELSVRALMENDAELASLVRARDDDLDALEMEIDAEAIAYMSLRAPVAKELRLVVVGMQAGHNLERVGDEANNIAKRVEKMERKAEGAARDELAQMSEIVVEMLRDAMDAFLQGDAEKALAICRRDEEVDRLDKRVYKGLSKKMIASPDCVPLALELMFISRSLERIGDHATNLAEEVVFLLQGRDIRHESADK